MSEVDRASIGVADRYRKCDKVARSIGRSGKNASLGKVGVPWYLPCTIVDT